MQLNRRQSGAERFQVAANGRRGILLLMSRYHFISLLNYLLELCDAERERERRKR